jgi:hypothetical protein
LETGTYISGAAHLALIGWALFGIAPNPEPLPFEVQEVAVISSAEFAALQAAQRPPGPVAEPAALIPPEAPAEVPELPNAPDPEPAQITPDVAEAPPPDEAPIRTPDPLPQAEVSEAPPEITPPGEDVAALLPLDQRPQPRPAERIAPQAVAPPAPEAIPDEIEREAVVPEEGERAAPQEPQEATAPEEAAPEIVTEAEEPAGAPTRSIRPSSRPARPTPAAAPSPEPQTADAVNEAVNDAVAEALREAQTAAPSAPSGPPLSAGERDALRVAVSSCWNVGSLSTEALQTTVVVGVDMQEDARPVAGSIRMLSFSGGSEAAARQAFEAARRAIIRCGSRGFQLPAEKYGQWREIEMTFNPENMRIR